MIYSKLVIKLFNKSFKLLLVQCPFGPLQLPVLFVLEYNISPASYWSTVSKLSGFT